MCEQNHVCYVLDRIKGLNHLVDSEKTIRWLGRRAEAEITGAFFARARGDGSYEIDLSLCVFPSQAG